MSEWKSSEILSVIISLTALVISFIAFNSGSTSAYQAKELGTIADNGRSLITQVIYLRSIDSSAMVSEDTLASINKRQADAIIQLTGLNDKAQMQIGDLIAAVHHLSSIDTMTRRQMNENNQTDFLYLGAQLRLLDAKTFYTCMTLAPSPFLIPQPPLDVNNQKIQNAISDLQEILTKIILNKQLQKLKYTRQTIMAYYNFNDTILLAVIGNPQNGIPAMNWLPRLYVNWLYGGIDNDSAHAMERIKEFNKAKDSIVLNRWQSKVLLPL